MKTMPRPSLPSSAVRSDRIVGDGQPPDGRIEVSSRAIARIAQAAALESYGVVGLSQRLRQWLGRLLGWPGIHRGIEVRFNNRQVIIDLYVVVAYGTRISEVAENVAERVRFTVERALGLPLVQVNVNVQKVRIRS